jgi:hypothetical protein
MEMICRNSSLLNADSASAVASVPVFAPIVELDRNFRNIGMLYYLQEKKMRLRKRLRREFGARCVVV